MEGEAGLEATIRLDTIAEENEQALKEEVRVRVRVRVRLRVRLRLGLRLRFGYGYGYGYVLGWGISGLLKDER